MELADLLDDLRSTTSSTEKEEILRKYLVQPFIDWDNEFIRFLLREAYDPKILHNVVLTKKDLPNPGNSKLGEKYIEVGVVLENISGNHSSQQNKAQIVALMRELTMEDQMALMEVVNKKLRCGVGIKTLNKVIPDMIPVVEIQLANTYDPNKTYYESYWWASPKLDGRRVFAIRNNSLGKWELYSRNKDYLGSEITTLDHWKPDLEKYYEEYGVDFADGEAYNHGMTFDEIESLVGSTVNLKDTTPLKYYIFFSGNLAGDIKRKKLKMPQRLDTLRLQIEVLKIKYLVGWQQNRVENTPDAMYTYLEEVIPKGYEGAMFRSSRQWYDFKRSDKLLKLKSSDTTGTEITVDCYVIDIEYGDFVVRENGVEAIEFLPVRLIVVKVEEEDPLPMKVGSGFSLKQRRDWAEDETLILGKAVEIKCQGFGSHGRMRFPRLDRIRGDL